MTFARVALCFVLLDLSLVPGALLAADPDADAPTEDAADLETIHVIAITPQQGASLPEELAATAANLAYPALALLDRDGVYGAPRFYLLGRFPVL